MAEQLTVEQALIRFKASTQKSLALNYASSIMFWDASTGAPKSGSDTRSQAIGTLSGFEYEMLVNPEMAADLELLMANLETLDEVDRVSVSETKKAYDKLTKIPMDDYQKYSALISKSAMVWEESKEKSDFESFKPYLSQVIDYLLKFASYRGYEGHPYNLYIGDYEPGMDVAQLDVFFDELRARIVPLLKRIKASGQTIDNGFLYQSFPVAKQAQVSEALLKQMGFDLSRGWLKESVHPFTMGVDMDDVRLTTHYYENDFASALLSTAHEGGHAIYEQNIDSKLRGTGLAHGTSNGIHESQSRIYENNFVKSRAFLSHYFPVLKETFSKQFENVDFETFYRGMNKVEPSLIRIEADELTYALHIMVRYEIELGLIDGSILVEDLPRVWNEKMSAYLGIRPASDKEGVLQDVHWSEGLFGYFPTYALGSAYAAQLEHHMRKTIDLDGCLEKGDFGPLTQWLSEHVHRHGAMLKPVALIEAVTGEPLNSKYYCDYLEKKYSAIYGLD